MAVRPILLYGDPRLEMANEPVVDFDEQLQEIITDLFETGWKAPGLGLAAPQIGVSLKLATVDLSVGKDPSAMLVLANPEIIRTEGKTKLEEGCLSFPGLYTNFERPHFLRLRAHDRHGNLWERDADGLLAQAVCHEIDHLNGVLLIHHIRGVKKQMFMRKIAKMRKLGVWAETA